MSVIVYQMGKVGSQALCKALRNYGINAEHVHYYKTIEGEFTMAESLKSYDRMVKGIGHRIITLVRDPLRRNLSAFLWGINRENYFHYPSYNPEVLGNLFINHYRHEWCLEWFDLEPKRALGLDVYSHPFNKEKGTGWIKHKEWETTFAILRTEKLDTPPAKKVIEDLLGIRDISIPQVNKTDKWYYEEFLGYLAGKVPLQLMDKLYQSKFAQHFLTDEEIEKAYNLWTLA